MPQHTDEEVDKHVGHRIRQRRHSLGLTQQKVAGLIGVQFQQLQKYETGRNRVSASRLWRVAEALNATPAFFFEGLGGDLPEAEVRTAKERELLTNFRGASVSAQDALQRIAQEAASLTTPTLEGV